MSVKSTLRRLTLVSTLGWFLASSVPVCAQDAPQPSVADAARAARKDKDKAKDKDATATKTVITDENLSAGVGTAPASASSKSADAISSAGRPSSPSSSLDPAWARLQATEASLDRLEPLGPTELALDRLERKHHRLPEPRRLGRKALFREGNLRPAFATTDRSDETSPRRHGSLAVQRPRQNCGQRSASAGVDAQVATNYATRGAHRIRIPVGHHRRPKPGVVRPSLANRFLTHHLARRVLFATVPHSAWLNCLHLLIPLLHPTYVFLSRARYHRIATNTSAASG